MTLQSPMQEIAQLLLDRRGTKPGDRPDRAHIALVIEGGGMRGVVGAGAASALYDLGLVECFDDLYGVSAGALSAAYMLGGPPHEGTRMYWETLIENHLIQPTRALRGGPALDLDYLIDRAMADVVPLDERAVAASPVRLHVIASSLDQRCAVSLDDNHGPLRERLRASAAVPLCSGGPVKLAGEYFIDGCIYEPLPVARAMRDGATHVMVIRTRPRTVRAAQPPGSSRVAHLFDHAVYARHPELHGTPVVDHDGYLRQLDALDSWNGPGQVLALAPGGHEILPFSRRPAELAAGARRGYQMVTDAFDSDLQSPFVCAAQEVAPTAHHVRPRAAALGLGVGLGGLALAVAHSRAPHHAVAPIAGAALGSRAISA